MEYIILLIFSFFTEAVILWQYAASLFSPSHSGKKRLTLLSVLYVLLFFLSLLGQTWLNIISFFVINTVFLYIMFNLKLLLALFHSAILTAIMGISELAVLGMISRFFPHFLLEMKDDILLVTGLMLLFGAWFCFFAKDILPTYYDANKINYVSQGIFRIHLVGLSFNNGNWMYICTTLKIWTLATVVLYPLAGIIIINCLNIALWDILNKIFLIMILGGMVVSIYIIGKKYE